MKFKRVARETVEVGQFRDPSGQGRITDLGFHQLEVWANEGWVPVSTGLCTAPVMETHIVHSVVVEGKSYRVHKATKVSGGVTKTDSHYTLLLPSSVNTEQFRPTCPTCGQERING